MDWFQHIRNQLIERFGEMPVGQRVFVGSLLATAMIGVIYALGTQVSESHIELLHRDIPSRQLSAYELAFAKAGLSDYAIKNQRIEVPKSQKNKYISALSEANLLPAGTHDFVDKVMEGGGILVPPHAAKARLKAIRQEKLAHDIRQMNGIDEASVNYDMEEKPGLKKERKYTASVTVRPSNNQPLAAEQAQTIKEHLAFSIAGLTSEDVYIVDLNATPNPAQPTPAPVKNGSTGNALAQRQSRSATVETNSTAKGSSKSSPGGFIVLGLVCIIGIFAMRKLYFPDSGKTESTFDHQSDVSIAPMEEPFATKPNNEYSHHSRVDAKLLEQVQNQRRSTLLTYPGESSHSRLVPKRQTSGIDLNDQTSKLLAFTPPPTEASVRPFGFVNAAGTEDLAQLLIHENAQIIAAVFSHLKPEQAAAVLPRLPNSLQIDVVRRLSDLEDLPDEVIQEIERGLEVRLAAQLDRKEKRNAGIQAVSGLLKQLSGTERTSIMDGLAEHNNELAEQLPFEASVKKPDTQSSNDRTDQAPEAPSFDTFTQLDGESLCRVLKSADVRDAVLALSDVNHSVLERVTGQMRPDEAERLRDTLTQLGPTNSSEVKASQRSLAKIADRLNQTGQLRRSA